MKNWMVRSEKWYGEKHKIFHFIQDYSEPSHYCEWTEYMSKSAIK